MVVVWLDMGGAEHEEGVHLWWPPIMTTTVRHSNSRLLTRDHCTRV